MSNSSDYEQRGYDANSNVTSFRNRAGETIAFTFDALNRMTYKDLPGTEPDVTYTYDLLGRLRSANDTTGYQGSFGYDALGRRTSEGTNWYGTKSSAYDAAGRRTRLTWRDGFYVDYDYLVTGEMAHVRENGAASGVGVLATYAYDDLGRRTSLTRGDGSTASYNYDGASRLTQLAEDLAGTAYDQTLGFSFNPAGQITSNTRSNDAYAWTGHYNANRGYTANGLNQYTASGSVTPTYDAKGNLTSAGGASYVYTSENKLANAGGSNIAYDPLGRMLAMAANGGVFDYDGNALVLETDIATGTVVRRRYVHGAGVDEPLVWYEGSGTSDRRFLHQDERGSVVAVTDSSGNTLTVNTYDEYGIPRSTNSGRFQYTGQAWLPELGMYYYRARIYSPTLGRFLQTDPIRFDGGMNIYAAMGADPVNRTDPSGLLAPPPLEDRWPVKPVDGRPASDDQEIVITGIREPGPDLSVIGRGAPISNGELGGGGGGGGGEENCGDSCDAIIVTAKRPHKYVLPYLSPCPASAVFKYFTRPGHSAPGAPATHEGFTRRIVLTGGNPISQFVNSSTGTIINTALPTHRYYPGTVTIQVTPLSSQTSTLVITGEGTGEHAEENIILGEAWFGATGAGAAAPEVCRK